MILSPEISGFRSPYPDCEIAQNGISPNGQVAFILGYSTEEGVANPPNCLAVRSRPGEYFELPTQIDSSSLKRESYDGVIRWAKDSSAVLCFKNSIHPTCSGVFSRGAYDIYIVPIINGQPGKITGLEIEILKVSHADFAKAIERQMKFAPDFYSMIWDQGLEDNLTFNDSNQLVINCYCSNVVRDSDNDLSWGSWTAHVTGLWDPIQGRFVKVSYERVAPAN